MPLVIHGLGGGHTHISTEVILKTRGAPGIMSELFDKQSECIKREFEENFWGLRKLPQAHEKCAIKMKELLEEEKQ